jgi:hypothetical protein
MAWPFGNSSSSSRYRRPSSHAGSSWSRPSSSSHYKRRPRDGYIERLIYKLKHFLRELWYYLRRNPTKVFFLVIMPLISGGALAAFARQFGVRLPDFLSGKGAREVRESGGYYGSRGYGGSEGIGGLNSGGLGALMSVAKAFM